MNEVTYRMRTMLWTAALLLGVGFSFALPAAPGSADRAPAAQVQVAAATDARGGLAAEPAAASAAPADAAPQAPAPAAGDAAAAQQTTPQTLAAAKPVDLNQTIDRWRQTLAREDGFQTWRNATWTSYPLGPGMHGYVVLLQGGGKEVGYMIVSAAEDGTYKLTEYGTGPRPLFSLATLYRSLVQLELIPSSVKLTDFLNDLMSRKERLYAGPLHAVWKLTVGGEVVYLDAKTGEKQPVDETLFPKQKNATQDAKTPPPGKIDSTPAVLAKLLHPSFDPYDRISWVTGKPIALATFDHVKKALAGEQRLVYVAELYNTKVTIPLAVIGYHVWSAPTESYLAVEQDGVRYIRYAALSGTGRFFP